MNKFFTLSILAIFLFPGCAVQHHTISGIRNWNYPITQINDTLSLGFVDGVLEKTGNLKPAKWATRKNIHVVGIKLINNSKTPIHGSQLAFYSNEQKIEMLHNRWLARKVRQRISPLMGLAIPFLFIEEALFHNEGEHDINSPFYESNPQYITTEVTSREQKKRKQSNNNLQQELVGFQTADKTLFPGKPVYGIIGFKNTSEINNLKVSVKRQEIDLFP